MKKDTEEITIINAEKTPKKLFNPAQYQKLFEVATVKVIIYDIYFQFKARSYFFIHIPFLKNLN